MKIKKNKLLTWFIFLPSIALAAGPPPIPKIPLPESSLSEENTDNSVEGEKSRFLEPPPQVKLNIPPPQNEEEALDRIRDFLILRKIIPPGTSEESLKKQIFGEYKDLVEPYIEEEEKANGNGYLDNIPDRDSYSRSEFQKFQNQESTYSQQEEKAKKRKIKMEHQKDSNNTFQGSSHKLTPTTSATVRETLNSSSKTAFDEKSFPLLPLISFIVLVIMSVAYFWILLGWRKK